jgi:hypothetical protein
MNLRLSEDEIYELQENFKRSQHLVFKNNIDKKFLNILEQFTTLKSSVSVEHEYDDIGHEILFKNLSLDMKLKIFLSSNEVLNLVSLLTGVSPLKSGLGRFSILKAGTDMQYDWHDDSGQPNREVAIRIELSRNSYNGGEFEFRNKGSESISFAISGLDYGDISIFRVNDAKYEHRVKPVVGNADRVSYIGWFSS